MGQCRLLVIIRTERQRVAKFPIALCRLPSTHKNATYIILKVIYRTRLATTILRLASKCYVFISQVNTTSNFTGTFAV